MQDLARLVVVVLTLALASCVTSPAPRAIAERMERLEKPRDPFDFDEPSYRVRQVGSLPSAVKQGKQEFELKIGLNRKGVQVREYYYQVRVERYVEYSVYWVVGSNSIRWLRASFASDGEPQSMGTGKHIDPFGEF